MFELKVTSRTNKWWNFLRILLAENPGADKPRDEQLAIVNDALQKYNAGCYLDTLNITSMVAQFETEEDYVVFKLKYS